MTISLDDYQAATKEAMGRVLPIVAMLQGEAGPATNKALAEEFGLDPRILMMLTSQGSMRILQQVGLENAIGATFLQGLQAGRNEQGSNDAERQ